MSDIYRRRKLVNDAIGRFRFKRRFGEEEGRPIESVWDLLAAIELRARSERQAGGLFTEIATLLSPPDCRKYHCPAFTAYAVSCCARGKVPGRCPDNRAYLKRRKERAEKAAASVKSA